MRRFFQKRHPSQGSMALEQASVGVAAGCPTTGTILIAAEATRHGAANRPQALKDNASGSNKSILSMARPSALRKHCHRCRLIERWEKLLQILHFRQIIHCNVGIVWIAHQEILVIILCFIKAFGRIDAGDDGRVEFMRGGKLGDIAGSDLLLLRRGIPDFAAVLRTCVWPLENSARWDRRRPKSRFAGSDHR